MFVSNEVFNYVLSIESVLAEQIKSTVQSDKFLSNLCKKISLEIKTSLPQCCNLPNLILQRTVLILSHRYLSSVFKLNKSLELISYNQSTSGGRAHPKLENL